MTARRLLSAVMLAATAAMPLAAQPVPLADRSAILRGVDVTDDPVRLPRRPRPTDGGQLVLTNGRIFTAADDRVREGSVVIADGRIRAVLPAGSRDWAANARVIDVAGKTIMPGLIDMHVHLTYPDRDTALDEQADDASAALIGARNLRWFLESGFTTVRDLNGAGNAPYILSRWSADGDIPAPRVVTAGHIITGTGGHATERPITPTHGPDFAWEIDGAEAWRAAVRRTFKAGAQVIKIASHFAPDEVAAAVDEAHRLGLKVTCDCESDYTDLAVAAGIDMIEHPLPRSDAAIAAMAKRGIAAVPTVQVYQNLIDRAGGFYGSTSRRFAMTSESIFGMFRKLKAAGIVLGVGTDTIGEANKAIPNNFIGELGFFIRGGYTPAQALRAATATNARLLDMGDRLGTLEPGKLADIIVVDGRPDLDPADLRRISLVVKDGRIAVEDGRVRLVERPRSPAGGDR